MRDFDVCICGGGIAGVAAAIASARTGAKTCLLEREYALGGLATLGLIVVYLPLDDGDGYLMSGGIAEELLKLSWKYAPVKRLPDEWKRDATVEERAGKRYQTEYSPAAMILACEELLLKEGVTLFYDAQITNVCSEYGKVRSVTVAGKRGPEVFSAKAFVDCTGDADICFFGGEATVEEDRNVRTGWHYTYNGSDLKLHIVSDPLYSKIPDTSRYYNGISLDDISAHCIDGRKFILESLEKTRETDPEAYPIFIPPFHGLRMTRRYKAQGIEFDAEKHERVWFADAIGTIGDWTALHRRYSLPYTSIKTTVNDNLYVAGRACAAEGKGWNMTRVIPTCAVTGEAAGTAAGMQAISGKAPEAPELQERLKENGVLLDPSMFTSRIG